MEPAAGPLGDIPAHLMAEAFAGSHLRDRAVEELANTAKECRQAILEHTRRIHTVDCTLREYERKEDLADAGLMAPIRSFLPVRVDRGSLIFLWEERGYRATLKAELEAALEDGMVDFSSEDNSRRTSW